MARRIRQGDDRLEKLARVAQILNLFQAPQQNAEDNRIRTALAVLGLQQQDRNAGLDRAERGTDRAESGRRFDTQLRTTKEEGEATRGFTKEQNEANRTQSGDQFTKTLAEQIAGRQQQGDIANRGLNNQEKQITMQDLQFGKRLGLDEQIFGHAKETDQTKMGQALLALQLQAQGMEQDRVYKDKDLTLRGDAIKSQKDVTERGQDLAFSGSLVGQPGMDFNKVLGATGIPKFAGIGTEMAQDKTNATAADILTGMPSLSPDQNYLRFSTAPENVQRELLKHVGVATGPGVAGPAPVDIRTIPFSLRPQGPLPPRPANINDLPFAMRSAFQ